MAQKTTGSRYRLGEPLSADLSDFCAALLGPSEIAVIREAVREYIDRRVTSEFELRRRYLAARQARLGAVDTGNVVPLPSPKGGK